MKTFHFSKNQKGNAILISLGVTSFMFVVAAGAGSLIDSSLRQSPKVVNSGKAFYAAEGAVESALFQASGRASGYETTSPPTLDMQYLNKTQAVYTASSREDLKRIRDDAAIAHNRTMYIPPRTVTNTSTTYDEFKITSLTGNWKKVRFGQAYPFDLFVDDSDKFMETKIGDTTSTVERFIDCEPLIPFLNKPVTCRHEELGYLATFIPYDLNNDPDPITYCYVVTDTPPYSKVEYCELPGLIDNTGDDCSGTDEILGPNNICSSETKSLFEDENGNANTKIESVFFDVYIPNAKGPTDRTSSAPILSWRMEGKTQSSDSYLPPQLEIFSANRCEGDSISFGEGTICTKYFDIDASPLPGTSDGKYLSRHQDSDNGIWVRIENPMGIMKGKEKVFPVPLLHFISKNITSPDGTENLNGYNLYFPRLTLQMGKPQEWKMFDDSRGTISEAYIRIGFRYFQEDFDLDNMIIQDFPIPSDKTTIQATGSADGYTQKINVEISPQELAPMFEYAVFQP